MGSYVGVDWAADKPLALVLRDPEGLLVGPAPWWLFRRGMGLFAHTEPTDQVRGCVHRQRSTGERESSAGN